MKGTKLTLLVVLTPVLVGLLISSVDAGGRRGARRAAVVPPGTQVTLVFDQALSSKTAKVGQRVKLHVANDVKVGNEVIIKSGSPVTGVISKVDKRKRYGVNATVRIALNPVKTSQGMVNLEPRSQGGPVGGKTGRAAAATAGGAAILGPVGLIGGYFVSGKSVNIKVGDKLETEVAQPARAAGGGAAGRGGGRGGARGGGRGR